ncbi:MAG: 23S rRNA (adenine(2503)-C(2))-methyltransferase RlmN [Eubacteriales bacterium]|nr:23S rRNA (adenine(2503)-C(2))-methyltransferase RlmN [Eubacteriales bacterium]
MNNLLDYDLTELTKIIENMGEPKYRAKQLYNAILNGKNYGQPTVLPQALLDKLSNNGFDMQSVKIYKVFKSKDKTIKFLYKLNDDNIIEGVLMTHVYGRTLCISTQVGCKMNCSFCASGLNFVRNLTAGEILGQIVAVNTYLKGGVNNREITNLVLMGSGEPLDNFDNVVKFLKLVTSPDGFNFSVRNITLSTCGIPSKIEKLADIGLSINLAISLHAPNDEIRRSIMPVAKSFSIESVIEAANYYHTITNRMIYIEYTLIDGVNSSIQNAQELASLLRNLDCRVNLISLNEVKERGLKGITANKTNAFLRELLKNGVSATVRRSLGDDVDGACGQLRNNELKGNLTQDSSAMPTQENSSVKAKKSTLHNTKPNSNSHKLDNTKFSKSTTKNSYGNSYDNKNNHNRKSAYEDNQNGFKNTKNRSQRNADGNRYSSNKSYKDNGFSGSKSNMSKSGRQDKNFGKNFGNKSSQNSRGKKRF